MRILWTLFKVIVGLAIAIPLAVVALGVSIAIVAVMLGLAVLVLKLACIGFVGYGLYRVARHLFGSAPPSVRPRQALPMPDPYYDAAMREIDREMGTRA